MLLVIEDGHWADAPTLLLLRHLAQTGWTGRVLLFATFRDTDADVPEVLSGTLADLRRSDDVVRLRLGGLSDKEVSEFVARISQGQAGAELEETPGIGQLPVGPIINDTHHEEAVIGTAISNCQLNAAAGNSRWCGCDGV